CPSGSGGSSAANTARGSEEGPTASRSAGAPRIPIGSLLGRLDRLGSRLLAAGARGLDGSRGVALLELDHARDELLLAGLVEEDDRVTLVHLADRAHAVDRVLDAVVHRERGRGLSHGTAPLSLSGARRGDASARILDENARLGCGGSQIGRADPPAPTGV